MSSIKQRNDVHNASNAGDILFSFESKDFNLKIFPEHLWSGLGFTTGYIYKYILCITLQIVFIKIYIFYLVEQEKSRTYEPSTRHRLSMLVTRCNTLSHPFWTVFSYLVLVQVNADDLTVKVEAGGTKEGHWIWTMTNHTHNKKASRSRWTGSTKLRP